MRPARNRNVTGQPRVSYYPLQGGEDLISPAFKASPGSLRSSLNYECDENGRYRRIDGYEVFDGRSKPSDASYWILNFTDGNAAMSQGDTVTGAGGATGTLITQVLSSGSYAGGDAAGYLVLSNVSGTYVDDENLQVSAVTEAVADGTASQRGASTTTLDSTYLQAAIEYWRDQIAAPAGSGTPLGVWQYNGVKYCWRNNSGGTAAVMFKSSATGWTACDLGRTVAFTSGGTTEITENMVLVGATSSAEATVKRVITTSGTWAAGTAAGTFVLYSQTGTFQSENLNIDGGDPNQATIAGNSTATTLLPDGKFRCINANFYGSSQYYRMYGCDGVNKAFEWDGSTFVPITTGMTADTPEHIFKFQNHLFLAFPGGSLQNSSLGSPYEWSAITGAAEIGVGQEITGLFEMPGPVFVIFARNRVSVLSGTSNDDWALSHYSLNSGAIEDTIQKIGSGIYLDDRGITTLATAQEYGNFKDATISQLIQPLIDYKLKNSISVQCSVAVKDKNQYRVLFNDKTAITLTLKNGMVVGYTRQEYDDQFTAMVSTENSTGFEEIFACCDDGFIYQIDKGTSFDGDAVYAMLRTHFNHLNTPSNRKRIRKIELELEAAAGTELNLGIEYDYSETSAGGTQAFDIPAIGGLWGDITWGDFTWGGSTVGSATAKTTGSGKNFCIVITSEQTYVDPHTIQGVIIHYDIRGLRR